VGQIPIFHDQRPGGRPFNAKDHYTSKYLDAPNTPLFPFGHGLTYGDFRLSGLRVSPADPAAGSALEIRVDVVNRGRWTAEETLFLFTRQKRADVTTPVLELKGFGKIALEAGASGVLTLPLPQGLNPGPADIFVGPSADPAGLISQTILVHEA
jgi:beta-glucosidase